MKLMKIFRAPMMLVGLAAPLLLALPSRAQQEVSPDHYETEAVQSAPVAKAALAHKPTQIAAARAHRLDAAQISARLRPVGFIADGSTSAKLSSESLIKARATTSRKASAQNRAHRARKARKVSSFADNE